MLEPNAYSLFHFTRTQAVLKSILQNGLRYSFAFEGFNESVLLNLYTRGIIPTTEEKDDANYRGMAIPMISFCDIPLTRTYNHSHRYGKYLIGINKDFLCEFYGSFINPVFYGDSGKVDNALRYLTCAHGYALKYFISLIGNGKHDKYKDIYEAFESNNQPKARQALAQAPKEIRDAYEYFINLKISIEDLISYYKPTYGVNYKGEKQSFYDEREWRAVMPNQIDTPFEWHYPICRDEYNEIRNDINNRLNGYENAYITIPGHWFNMINHIIVPSEKKVQGIVKFIATSDKLLGYDNVTHEQRLHLISKVTSFERINTDY